jgi:hypothetical protein
VAPLYGRMRPDQRQVVTRTARKEIGCTLQTWEGFVSVSLWADGHYVVTAAPFEGYPEVVAQGDVNGAAKKE